MPIDYYELLQISPNAEPDTIQRVYRLLAQRYHPDNLETGNAAKFRLIHEAYSVLSDPDARVKYDVAHRDMQQDRWRLISLASAASGSSRDDKMVRLTVLDLLCAQRRVNPTHAGLFPGEIEKLTGITVEHLEFCTWYLIQKRLIRAQPAQLVITAGGRDYPDENPHVVHSTSTDTAALNGRHRAAVSPREAVPHSSASSCLLSFAYRTQPWVDRFANHQAPRSLDLNLLMSPPRDHACPPRQGGRGPSELTARQITLASVSPR
jgi:curved DNA-binding protein CbpA